MTIEIADMWADILGGVVRTENGSWIVVVEVPESTLDDKTARLRSPRDCFELALVRALYELKKRGEAVAQGIGFVP
jgi:hypothetical protein